MKASLVKLLEDNSFIITFESYEKKVKKIHGVRKCHVGCFSSIYEGVGVCSCRYGCGAHVFNIS